MNRSAENEKNGQKCENFVIANDAKIPHNKEKSTKNSCPTGGGCRAEARVPDMRDKKAAQLAASFLKQYREGRLRSPRNRTNPLTKTGYMI